MKRLRILITVNAAFYILVGILIGREEISFQGALWIRALPLSPLEVMVGFVLLSLRYLVGNSRRLAFGVVFANLLIGAAGLYLFTHGRPEGGWLLGSLGFAIVLAGLAAKADDGEAGELLWIPKVVRRGLFRQFREAAAQEERNRLARDLHDSIKQQLFTINVSTAAAQERWETDPEGAKAALADVRRSAREAMVEMQALLHQLRPQALGSTAGLIGALREQCEALEYRTGAQVSLEIGPEIPDDRMPAGGREALFRIAQEALANVARHARARTVWLRIGRDGETALLRIADDGQGFEPGAVTSGMGLRNLRERAEALGGTMSIVSAPGAGTRIAIQVPLSSSPPTPTLRRDFGELAWGLGLLSYFMLTLSSPTLSNKLSGGDAILMCLLVVSLNWWFSRQNSGPYVRHRRETVIGLCLAWVWWFDIQDRHPPWLLLLYAVYALYAFAFVTWVGWCLVRFHRVSQLRRFWRPGERHWLGLLTIVALQLVLSLVAPNFGGLALKPPILLLPLFSAAVFAYLISRQPRNPGDLA